MFMCDVVHVLYLIHVRYDLCFFVCDWFKSFKCEIIEQWKLKHVKHVIAV